MRRFNACSQNSPKKQQMGLVLLFLADPFDIGLKVLALQDHRFLEFIVPIGLLL